MAPNRMTPRQRRQHRLSLLPPGFRFRPTDAELAGYLRKKVQGEHIAMRLFHEVNLFDYHPRRLLELFDKEGEKKVYLLSPTRRKYPNGERPGRTAEGGYWKASGKDEPVVNEAGQVVGTKRALSFFEGHQPNGIKTHWLMHEYKVRESHMPPDPRNGCSVLDNWVLFVLYTKETSDEEGQEGSELNLSASEGGRAAASSQTNMVANLHMDAETTDNRRLGKNIVVGEASTSYGSHETTTHLQNYAAGCRVPLSSLNRELHRDRMYASNLITMDAQKAAALASAQIAAPFSFEPGSSTQSFQRGYYDTKLNSVDCDYPFVAPLSATATHGASIYQAPLITGNPGSSAQCLEHNHQGQGVEPVTVNCGTYSEVLCPSKPVEVDHLLANAMQRGAQPRDVDFNGWSSTSMNMHMVTSNGPAYSSPQLSQCNNHQGYFDMQINNGATSTQWNGLNQDLGYGGWSGTSVDMGATTSYEFASPAPQYLQYGNHQGYRDMQILDNGSDVTGSGGSYNSGSWCFNMSSSSDEQWNGQLLDLGFDDYILDALHEALLEANINLEPAAPGGVDNPPTSQAYAGVAEEPHAHMVPESTAADAPLSAMINGMKASAESGDLAPVTPNGSASPLACQTFDSTAGYLHAHVMAETIAYPPPTMRNDVAASAPLEVPAPAVKPDGVSSHLASQSSNVVEEMHAQGTSQVVAGYTPSTSIHGLFH